MHLDGGDLGCARLLILLRARVQNLPPGTVVHLTTTDPVAPIDLPAWCRLTGHDYLGEIPTPSGLHDPPVRDPREATDRAVSARATTYAVRVGGEARGTDPDRPWHLVPQG